MTNRYSSKILHYIFLLSFSYLITSCDTKEETTISSVDVPELLDRSEKIQLGKEWESVQNQYMTNALATQEADTRDEALLNLAHIYVREARVTGEHGHYYPAALETLDRILASAPADADLRFRALVTKAGVELSLHEFATAKETATQAYRLNPLNAQINGVLVDAHVELGEYDKAVVAADHMVNIKPDLRSYSRVSYLREIHGDVDGAIEAMSYAVKAGYPGLEETAWAQLTLGNLYKEYGDLDTAEEIYEEILVNRPDYPFALGELADVAYQRGDLAKAEEILTEAMSIIPEVGFYVQMAEVYRETDRYESFMATMDEVFVMLADDERSGHNMNLEYADIYLNLYDDTDKAIEYAMKEYKKRPNNIDVNRQLAEIYVAMSDTEKAKIHIEKASITDSQDPKLVSLMKLTDSTKELSSL